MSRIDISRAQSRRLCVLTAAGQVPIYAPTLVKALEGKDVALVRSGQHHTLALTHAGASGAWEEPGLQAHGRRFPVALICLVWPEENASYPVRTPLPFVLLQASCCRLGAPHMGGWASRMLMWQQTQVGGPDCCPQLLAGAL